jgi:hypothetical protein
MLNNGLPYNLPSAHYLSPALHTSQSQLPSLAATLPLSSRPELRRGICSLREVIQTGAPKGAQWSEVAIRNSVHPICRPSEK